LLDAHALECRHERSNERAGIFEEFEAEHDHFHGLVTCANDPACDTGGNLSRMEAPLKRIIIHGVECEQLRAAARA
jgi:hypothetical protein